GLDPPREGPEALHEPPPRAAVITHPVEVESEGGGRVGADHKREPVARLEAGPRAVALDRRTAVPGRRVDPGAGEQPVGGAGLGVLRPDQVVAGRSAGPPEGPPTGSALQAAQGGDQAGRRHPFQELAPVEARGLVLVVLHRRGRSGSPLLSSQKGPRLAKAFWGRPGLAHAPRGGPLRIDPPPPPPPGRGGAAGPSTASHSPALPGGARVSGPGGGGWRGGRPPAGGSPPAAARPSWRRRWGPRRSS